ncbi:hypothetical protein BDP27DRAFT_1404850 [Rhodocollybia butyracea]|uniref:GOLD domain-containing protein n=1 Tax=Rhodocollybia butyracea TaxID=206335 RepID=A0A9P5PH97_9AGAR|nr:hypothetical protein BDP27DRAFT_1404850 [Rhodocollybia butyracea]
MVIWGYTSRVRSRDLAYSHQSNDPSDGKFTYTLHEAGDHSICLSTNYTSLFSSTHIPRYRCREYVTRYRT